MDKQFEKLLAQYDQHCIVVNKATQVKLGESVEEKNKRMSKLEKKYTAWFEYYFPHYAKCKCAKFHQQMADAVIKNKKIKLLAEIYRSGAKSAHVTMGLPLFLYLVCKDLFFMLLIGETETKGKQLIGDIQAELMFNERLKNDYGSKYKQGDWADGNFYTSDGVRFMSLGFGQSPRGLREGARRPDYIVPDDVDTKKHVNSDRIMRESVDYLMEEVMGCFDASDDSTERFVYSNNNFHKNSITNRLKNEFKLYQKKDEEAGNKTNYKIITVPAVKDLVLFEPTWPEKTTSSYWRDKYNKRPRSFMREYMHMHVQEGKIFKPEHLQWKEMLKLDKYDGLVLYGDLSYKEQADFKAMILMGKIDKEFHIIHSFCRQTSRSQVAKWLYDLYEVKKLVKYNIKYKIEGLFAMDEFISDFDNEGAERGYYIPVIADKRGKANKHDRIESTEAYFERRWVFFNEKEKGSTDQQEVLDQLLAFEKGSQAHDDAPDCIHGCIDELLKITFVEKFEPRVINRDVYNNDFNY
jgi:predicted phage terminase large subunit-like protein